MLNQKKLKELLSYDRESGKFSWIKHRSPSRIGSNPAYYCKRGYLHFEIAGKEYFAHRLAWLYVYGMWPTDEIDHINGHKDDNRICNLRDVSRSINSQNMRSAKSQNKCGYLGVQKKHRRWQALIQSDGVRYVLGRFSTPEEASAAYLAAKRRLHKGCTI